MRRGILAAAVLATSAMAAEPGEKTMPTNQKLNQTVTQPLADVNLKRRAIPPELLAIRNDPYSLEGVRTCRQLIAEVEKLDSALGPDFDQIAFEDRGTKRRDTALSLAGGVMTSFIPFRGLIREVSGANKADADYRSAIYAGAVRRGFLKGYGEHRRCKAPGRPLNTTEQTGQADALAQDAEEKK